MERTSILLPTGQSMPIIGFGTWHATDDEMEEALDAALEAGYRHIDTAPVYKNEKAIGKVLKKWFDSGRIKRSDLFIVTKLPPTGNNPKGVEKWIKNSLNDLQLNYLDLYLIHTAFSFEDMDGDYHPTDENGDIKLDNSTDHVKVWKEMEKQVKCGRTKAIGLSNFNITQIENILKHAELPISNLQIEMHLYFQQNQLVEFCKKNKINVTAYSPLGSRGFVKLIGKTEEIPDILQNPVVLEIAKKYKKSSAQISLKYLIGKGVVVIPKSTNPKRIKENLELFDWKLQMEDLQKLEKLNMGSVARICDFTFLNGIKRHPQYPF